LDAKTVTRLSRVELGLTLAKLELLQNNPRASLAEFLEAAAPIFSMSLRGTCRPNLVLFGDQMPMEAWQTAVGAATQCDCMLVVGTSELVVPAATLPVSARGAGAKVIRVDPIYGECDIWLPGDAGEILPRLLYASAN
jgi:NAD-dependent SIR2 family protein deacetylase